MKKILLSLLVIITAIPLSYAQLQAGPRAGLTGYQIITGGNNNFRFGMYAGGFLEYKQSEKQNLQLDIAYVQKGAQDKDLGIVTKLDYLEVSPKVELFTKANADNRGFYISVGFGFNVLINDEVVLGEQSIYEDLGLKTFDLSLQLGLGYKLQNNLSVDLKLLDGSLTVASSEIDSFRNIGANLTLSYGFDL